MNPNRKLQEKYLKENLDWNDSEFHGLSDKDVNMAYETTWKTIGKLHEYLSTRR